MYHCKENLARYYHKCIFFHVYCLLFFSDFNQTSILSTDFQNILQHQNSLKRVQWEPRFACGPPDGRTEGHDEANSNFSHMPKKEQKSKTLKNW